MDTGDILTDVEADQLMSDILDMYMSIVVFDKNIALSTMERCRKVIDYVYFFHDMDGLAVPTTCAYQHILVDNNIELIQFFLMHGIGGAVYIQDCVSHIFMQTVSFTIPQLP